MISQTCLPTGECMFESKLVVWWHDLILPQTICVQNAAVCWIQNCVCFFGAFTNVNIVFLKTSLRYKSVLFMLYKTAITYLFLSSYLVKTYGITFCLTTFYLLHLTKIKHKNWCSHGCKYRTQNTKIRASFLCFPPPLSFSIIFTHYHLSSHGFIFFVLHGRQGSL